MLIFRKFVQDLIKRGGEPEVESVKRTNLAAIPGATLQDYFELNAVRSKVKAAFQKFWLEHRLDALLYPPASTTATPLDEWKCITYTMLWNLLDYPAVIIPTGRVCETDSADGIENATFGPEDKENYKLCKYYVRCLLAKNGADDFCKDTGPQDFKNAPLSVQLVGMRQEDDRLMGIAQLVDDALH